MLSFTILSVIMSLASAQVNGPPTIEELDVPMYLGRWYQMYASPIVYETFEKDGLCNTATYGVFNESTLTVYNNQRLLTPDGEEDDIEGFAYTTDDPAKLLVDFGFEAYGNYWIMKLGAPREYDGEMQYPYSLVSERTRTFLFVLARDVDQFRNEYDEEVLAWLYGNGFDQDRNRPIESYHEADCIYPPLA